MPSLRGALRFGPYVAVLVVSFVAYWSQARTGLFPPDSDPAYYVLGARSLLQGHGLSVAVVWHFLHATPTMPQPGFELWMPGASVAVAALQTVLGDSYSAACTAAAVFGAVATALSVAVARRLLGDWRLALACGGLFVLNERVMLHATSPDSTIFYTVWVLACLTLTGASLEHRDRLRTGLTVAAGLAAAAAALTRNDALVTLPLTLALSAFAWRRGEAQHRLTRRDLTVAGIAFLAGLAPWSIRCLHAFGTVWSPASGKTPWLVAYHHLFSYPSQTSAERYWQHVVAHPWDTLAAKARGTYQLLYWVADLTGVLVVPLVLAGAVLAFRKERGFAVTGLALLGSLVAALGFVADRLVAGGSHRSILPLLPYLIAFALMLPSYGLRWVFRGPRAAVGEKVTRWLGLALASGVWLLVAASTVSRIASPETSFFEYQQAVHYRSAEAFLQRARLTGPVLAVRPAMASYGMLRPSVMTPTGDIEQICAAANHFGARSMVLSGYYLDAPGFETLRAMHRGRLRDPRVHPLAAQDSWVVFELRCGEGP